MYPLQHWSLGKPLRVGFTIRNSGEYSRMNPDDRLPAGADWVDPTLRSGQAPSRPLPGHLSATEHPDSKLAFGL